MNNEIGTARNNIDRWLKLAEWRGEVSQTLKGIRDELVEIKKSVREQRDTVMAVRLKVASIAATVSLVTTIVILVVGYFIRKGG